jgi:AcrR family transcriptional regulator
LSSDQFESPRPRSNAVKRKPPPPTTKRGNATRDRIKLALTSLLKQRAFHQIRLEDIADLAGVRVSLIYHYFQSKEDITNEVLADLLGAFSSDISSRAKELSPLEAIHIANVQMIELYSSNPGAMRCLVETQQGVASFSQMWRALTIDWNHRIAGSIARQFPGAFGSEADFLALAYALAGTVDNYLYEYFVIENEALRQVHPTQDALARFLTTIWHRALYLENPPPEFLGAGKGFDRIGRHLGGARS